MHLDLAEEMSTETFLRSFRRFVARRGMPARVTSDNAKTFISAPKNISSRCEELSIVEENPLII